MSRLSTLKTIFVSLIVCVFALPSLDALAVPITVQLIPDFNKTHLVSDVIHLGDNMGDTRFIPSSPLGTTFAKSFALPIAPSLVLSAELLIDQYQADNTVFEDRSFVALNSKNLGKLTHNPGISDLAGATNLPVLTDSFPVDVKGLTIEGNSLKLVAGDVHIGPPDTFDDFSVTNVRLVLNPVPCESLLKDVRPVAYGAIVTAIFEPKGATISEAEKICGVNHFNWVNQVNIPEPSPFYAAGQRDHPLTGWITDPPPGGYDTTDSSIYCNDKWNPVSMGPGEDSNPLYFGEMGRKKFTYTDYLKFYDAPNDPCLNDSKFLYFKTHLVGQDDTNDVVALPVDLFFEWKSNYNGTAGGATVLNNWSLAPDPGSGSGGVTILSINGFPVASVAEPSTEVLVCIGFVGLLCQCGFGKRRGFCNRLV